MKLNKTRDVKRNVNNNKKNLITILWWCCMEGWKWWGVDLAMQFCSLPSLRPLPLSSERVNMSCDFGPRPRKLAGYRPQPEKNRWIFQIKIQMFFSCFTNKYYQSSVMVSKTSLSPCFSCNQFKIVINVFENVSPQRT